MSEKRRVLTYVAIAVIVGAALALAVALSNTGAGAATGKATAGAGDGSPTTLLSDGSATGALAAADPAKEQPLLDEFTSKDPFIQFSTPGAATSRA